MNKKSVNEPTEPITRAKPRRVRPVTLFNATATLAAAVVAVCGLPSGPKLPPGTGE